MLLHKNKQTILSRAQRYVVQSSDLEDNKSQTISTSDWWPHLKIYGSELALIWSWWCFKIRKAYTARVYAKVGYWTLCLSKPMWKCIILLRHPHHNKFRCFLFRMCLTLGCSEICRSIAHTNFISVVNGLKMCPAIQAVVDSGIPHTKKICWKPSADKSNLKSKHWGIPWSVRKFAMICLYSNQDLLTDLDGFAYLKPEVKIKVVRWSDSRPSQRSNGSIHEFGPANFHPISQWKTCSESVEQICFLTPELQTSTWRPMIYIDLSFYTPFPLAQCPSNFCVEVRLLISLRPLCTAWSHGVRDIQNLMKGDDQIQVHVMYGLHGNRLCPSVAPAICSLWQSMTYARTIYTLTWWSMHFLCQVDNKCVSQIFPNWNAILQNIHPAWASMKDSKLASVLDSKSFGQCTPRWCQRKTPISPMHVVNNPAARSV